MKRKIISLTPTQELFVREAVNHVTEFGEDTGGSPQQVAGDLRTANGILAELANPIALGELLTAARNAARFIRRFEADWHELTDDQHGDYPGLVPLRRLDKALAKLQKHSPPQG